MSHRLIKVPVEAAQDDHVFILVTSTDERPAISLDITNDHGRRGLSVRVNGMSIGGMLLDVEELPPLSGEVFERHCVFCGGEINIWSSKSHSCRETIPKDAT